MIEDATRAERKTVRAVPSPRCDIDMIERMVADVKPRGVDRAITRWMRRLPALVWNDAALEGSLFTLPEVVTLIDGGSVPGHTEASADQVLDLSQAANYVARQAVQGPVRVSDQLSSKINAFVTAHEIIEPGVLRGEGRVGGEAVVNAMGDTFIALPTVTGGEALRAVFIDCTTRANAAQHPLAQAVVWAGLATYHQFYSNGNKRTARYVMNTVLMSHGYDAILTPVALKDEYNRVLHSMFMSNDVTKYSLFLANLYDDSHPSLLSIPVADTDRNRSVKEWLARHDGVTTGPLQNQFDV